MSRGWTWTCVLALLFAGCTDRAPARALARHSGELSYSVYVSNEASNDISVIDPSARRVVARIPVGKRPRGLRVDARSHTLWVAVSGSPRMPPGAEASAAPAPDRGADGIAAVDLQLGRLSRVLPSGPDPESFDLTPDGQALYVSNEDSAAASRLDLRTGSISHVVAVGAEPEGVAVRPDGAVVYVTSEQSDSIDVIDSRTHRRLRSVRVGRRPRGVLFSADGARAYVSNELSASVSVIDAREHEPIDTIAIPAEGASSLGVKPMGLALSPRGDRLFVSNGRGGTVSIVDLAARRVVHTVRDVGVRPWGIASSPDGRLVYTANGASNDVSVVDAETGTLLTRIPSSGSPWGVAIGPALPAKLGAVDAGRTRGALARGAADDVDGDWPMVARDYQNTRFSPLAQIDRGNVAALQPVWHQDTDIARGHEAAPLVIGDHMYWVTPYPNDLYAFDLSKPGPSVAWVYKPAPAAAAQGVACCDVVNRGAAYAEGKVFINTLDAHTVAVDARSGRELWKTKLGEINRGESITMAPLVVGKHVLVGNSGGEFGVRGWLTALDTQTGNIAWRAYSTGPDADVRIGAEFAPYYAQDRGPDLGVSSWPPGRWQTGGGTVWGFISYDPELDRIYYGTGNPGPWNPQQRPGANRWTAGIFARRPSDGQATWFYQWNPHDLFDHDGVNESIVVDLPWQGTNRKLLLHVDRNGYMYVLDRASGQVLAADAFVPITSSRGVDLQTGKLQPVAAKEPRLGQVVRGICPAAPGGKDWQPAAFSPRTRLLYIPHNNLCQDLEGTEANYIAGTPYVGANVRMYAGPGGHMGQFTAWDPLQKRAVWSIREKFPVWSGALVTAGDLVFYGTMEGWFKALDGRSGELLWSFKAPSGIVGQPISYRGPDGKQYIAVAVGVGGWPGVSVTLPLDARDQSAALGFGNAMRELRAHTRTGGALYVFGVP